MKLNFFCFCNFFFQFFIGLETFSIVSCSNRDTSPQNLSIMTLHTGEKIFNCKECTDVAFTSYEHLRTHTYKVHKGVRFICDLCRKEFSTSAVRSNHMKKVHGVKMGEMGKWEKWEKLDSKE